MSGKSQVVPQSEENQELEGFFEKRNFEPIRSREVPLNSKWRKCFSCLRRYQDDKKSGNAQKNKNTQKPQNPSDKKNESNNCCQSCCANYTAKITDCLKGTRKIVWNSILDNILCCFAEGNQGYIMSIWSWKKRLQNYMFFIITAAIILFFVVLEREEAVNGNHGREIVPQEHNIIIESKNCRIVLEPSPNTNRIELDFFMSVYPLSQALSQTVFNMDSDSVTKLVYKSAKSDLRNCQLFLKIPENTPVNSLSLICEIQCTLVSKLNALIVNNLSIAGKSVEANILNINVQDQATVNLESGTILISNFDIKNGTMNIFNGDIILQSVKEFTLTWKNLYQTFCFASPFIEQNKTMNCSIAGNASTNIFYNNTFCNGVTRLCRESVCAENTSQLQVFQSSGNLYANLLSDPFVDISYTPNLTIFKGAIFDKVGIDFDMQSKRTLKTYMDSDYESRDPIFIINFARKYAQRTSAFKWTVVSNPAFSYIRPWWMSVFSLDMLTLKKNEVYVNLSPGICPYHTYPDLEDHYRVQEGIRKFFNMTRPEITFIQNPLQPYPGNEFLNLSPISNHSTQRIISEEWLKVEPSDQGDLRLKKIDLSERSLIIWSLVFSFLAGTMMGITITQIIYIGFMVMFQGIMKRIEQFDMYSHSYKTLKRKSLIDENVNQKKEELHAIFKKVMMENSTFISLSKQIPRLSAFISFFSRIILSKYFLNSVEIFCHVLFDVSEEHKDMETGAEYELVNLNENEISEFRLKALYENFCFLNHYEESSLSTNKSLFESYGFEFEEQSVQSFGNIIIKRKKPEFTLADVLNSDSLDFFLKNYYEPTSLDTDTILVEDIFYRYEEFCEEFNIPLHISLRDFDSESIAIQFGFSKQQSPGLKLVRKPIPPQTETITCWKKFWTGFKHFLKLYVVRPVAFLLGQNVTIKKKGYFKINEKNFTYQKEFYLEKQRGEGMENVRDKKFSAKNKAVVKMMLYPYFWVPILLSIFLEIILTAILIVPFIFLSYLYEIEYESYSMIDRGSLISVHDLLWSPWELPGRLDVLMGWNKFIISLVIIVASLNFIDKFIYFCEEEFPEDRAFLNSHKAVSKNEFLRIVINLHWLIIFFLILCYSSYIGVVLMWLILGAIINPNNFLVYASSSLTLLTFVSTKYNAFKTLSTQGRLSVKAFLVEQAQAQVKKISSFLVHDLNKIIISINQNPVARELTLRAIEKAKEFGLGNEVEKIVEAGTNPEKLIDDALKTAGNIILEPSMITVKLKESGSTLITKAQEIFRERCRMYGLSDTLTDILLNICSKSDRESLKIELSNWVQVNSESIYGFSITSELTKSVLDLVLVSNPDQNRKTTSREILVQELFTNMLFFVIRFFYAEINNKPPPPSTKNFSKKVISLLRSLTEKNKKMIIMNIKDFFMEYMEGNIGDGILLALDLIDVKLNGGSKSDLNEVLEKSLKKFFKSFPPLYNLLALVLNVIVHDYPLKIGTEDIDCLEKIQELVIGFLPDKDEKHSKLALNLMSSLFLTLKDGLNKKDAKTLFNSIKEVLLENIGNFDESKRQYVEDTIKLACASLQFARLMDVPQKILLFLNDSSQDFELIPALLLLFAKGKLREQFWKMTDLSSLTQNQYVIKLAKFLNSRPDQLIQIASLLNLDTSRENLIRKFLEDYKCRETLADFQNLNLDNVKPEASPFVNLIKLIHKEELSQKDYTELKRQTDLFGKELNLNLANLLKLITLFVEKMEKRIALLESIFQQIECDLKLPILQENLKKIFNFNQVCSFSSFWFKEFTPKNLSLDEFEREFDKVFSQVFDCHEIQGIKKSEHRSVNSNVNEDPFNQNLNNIIWGKLSNEEKEKMKDLLNEYEKGRKASNNNNLKQWFQGNFFKSTKYEIKISNLRDIKDLMFLKEKYSWLSIDKTFDETQNFLKTIRCFFTSDHKTFSKEIILKAGSSSYDNLSTILSIFTERTDVQKAVSLFKYSKHFFECLDLFAQIFYWKGNSFEDLKKLLQENLLFQKCCRNLNIDMNTTIFYLCIFYHPITSSDYEEIIENFEVKSYMDVQLFQSILMMLEPLYLDDIEKDFYQFRKNKIGIKFQNLANEMEAFHNSLLFEKEAVGQVKQTSIEAPFQIKLSNLKKFKDKLDGEKGNLSSGQARTYRKLEEVNKIFSKALEYKIMMQYSQYFYKSKDETIEILKSILLTVLTPVIEEVKPTLKEETLAKCEKLNSFLGTSGSLDYSLLSNSEKLLSTYEANSYMKLELFESIFLMLEPFLLNDINEKEIYYSKRKRLEKKFQKLSQIIDKFNQEVVSKANKELTEEFQIDLTNFLYFTDQNEEPTEIKRIGIKVICGLLSNQYEAMIGSSPGTKTRKFIEDLCDTIMTITFLKQKPAREFKLYYLRFISNSRKKLLSFRTNFDSFIDLLLNFKIPQKKSGTLKKELPVDILELLNLIPETPNPFYVLYYFKLYSLLHTSSNYSMKDELTFWKYSDAIQLQETNDKKVYEFANVFGNIKNVDKNWLILFTGDPEKWRSKFFQIEGEKEPNKLLSKLLQPSRRKKLDSHILNSFSLEDFVSEKLVDHKSVQEKVLEDAGRLPKPGEFILEPLKKLFKQIEDPNIENNLSYIFMIFGINLNSHSVGALSKNIEDLKTWCQGINLKEMFLSRINSNTDEEKKDFYIEMIDFLIHLATKQENSPSSLILTLFLDNKQNSGANNKTVNTLFKIIFGRMIEEFLNKKSESSVYEIESFILQLIADLKDNIAEKNSELTNVFNSFEVIIKSFFVNDIPSSEAELWEKIKTMAVYFLQKELEKHSSEIQLKNQALIKNQSQIRNQSQLVDSLIMSKKSPVNTSIATTMLEKIDVRKLFDLFVKSSELIKNHDRYNKSDKLEKYAVFVNELADILFNSISIGNEKIQPAILAFKSLSNMVRGDFENVHSELFKLLKIEPSKQEIIRKVFQELKQIFEVPELYINSKIQKLSNTVLGNAFPSLKEIARKLGDNENLSNEDLFKLVDTDASGRINVNEFVTLTKRLNMALSDHRVQEIFSLVKVMSGENLPKDELNEKEFSLALNYIQEKSMVLSLEAIGISLGTLYFLLIWLTSILVLIIIFILIGIQAFAIAGTFGAIVNSLFPIAGGLVVNNSDSKNKYSQVILSEEFKRKITECVKIVQSMKI